RNGNPVRLGELGRVIDSVENERIAAWFNDDRALILAVQKQPGTNTIEIVRAIKRLLPTFQAQLPAAAQINVLFDKSLTIQNSVSDVKFTLLLTLALVVLVIFLFLRNLTATIIPSIAIPMSVAGTFAIMYVLGYSLDNFSLMALTLSVGFVVDDAIVVLENIVRHIERGEPVMEAAFKGSREIGFTVISMTLSLAAVFIPVLFMGGLIGRLLGEFSVTIGAAILVSGVVSLTLTPMMCSRFLRPAHSQHHGRLYAITERFFDGMLWIYRGMLTWVLRHRLVTLMVSALVLVGTGWLFLKVPQGFLPNEDQSRIIATTEAAQGVSFEEMVRLQEEVKAVLRHDPRVVSLMSALGARGGNATAANTGTIFATLVPRAQRNKNVDDIIQELRPTIEKIPGVRVSLQNVPTLRLGGTISKSQYQYTMQGPDLAEMYAAAPKLVEKLAALPGFQDVTSDLLISNPQVHIQIDRDKAAALGISAQQIELALESAYGTRQISTIYAPTNQYQVILEVPPEKRSTPESLPMLHLPTASGALVPLENVAKIVRNVGPLAINHLGQLPAVTISFNLAPDYALGPAVEQVKLAAAGLLPQTIVGSFQGTAQAFQSSQQGLLTLLILSILVIYMVLGMLYESFIHPLTILTALPFAGFGALLTLYVFKMDLNLYAFVGVIMLVGLVKKNGIMMVDFALESQRSEGLAPRDAIFQACIVRFRPIMMTTMAALMGTLPIALGF
ncbi:MAG: efflux RND transporter permease subunit, partial [Deltaproteobacteria bacterium]|nr:efflux RND transporter permease subunit [Deltaproteobacteria bacterium]